MNILNAIMNLSISLNNEVRNVTNVSNRMNSMGEGLENYVKDLFADTLSCEDELERKQKYSQVFSWLGNATNPPDIIIRGGDAIEVKKVESKSSDLALNSSYPKAKVFSDSPMIAKGCRACEEWKEKDIIYAVGHIPKGTSSVRALCFVYGADYSASHETYDRVKDGIRQGVLTIPDIEFERNTKELGRVNRVDPLGITLLRIRGMWHIKSPFKVFEYIYPENKNSEFDFMAIINEEKYNSFENKGEFERFVAKSEIIKITDTQVSSPDNPALLKDAKLITISY